MKISEAKESALGELDIMIDSAKNSTNKIPFDKVIAGDNFLRFDNSVHAVSWHGYYQISGENTVRIPTVHFKDDINLKRAYTDVKHIGTININEPFAFPICSIYIPREVRWLEGISSSNYSIDRKINYIFKDILIDENQRLDIFLTPKKLSARAILNGRLGFAYKFADVPLYNSAEGILVPLKEIQDNPNIDQESMIEIFSLGTGHDVIIRTVGDQNSNYSDLEGCYSLLVHDPNDSLNRIANRLFADIEENEIVRTGILKNEL